MKPRTPLVLIEKWEDEHAKYVLLGDRATHGAEYAELTVIYKPEAEAQ